MVRIAHIGDIHIRGLQRHEEYRRAFEDAFRQFKELKVDRIVVCGDIFHTKTQGITPEVIEFFSWWFNRMASICPVDITLGNHDGNLMNPQRQDAISPIINALNNPRITLYKKSGTYQFMPGFNWCVFSIFDTEGWDAVRPVPGDTNIALFHGSVAGSMTDSDWAMEADVKVEFFKDYDFTLLGDIHKTQFLDYRDEKPYIAYCGSTIQQSFGEDPGKGFLLWDIRSRDDFEVSFHQVAHDRPFMTIDWRGTIKETLSPDGGDDFIQFPAGVRVRVKSDTLIPQAEIKHLATELKRCGASEVVFKDDYAIDANVIDTKTVSFQKGDLHDVNVVMKLFKEFYGDEKLSQSDWDAIDGLVQTYIDRLNKEDVQPRNIRWQLKEMEFDNLFGYGKGNYINFERLSGITGIFGPNKIGKSSVIGALMYGLYNTTDRGSVKNLDVINTRKGDGSARVKFSIDDDVYRIERQSVKYETRGVRHAVTNLNFCRLGTDGKMLEDLNGEQRSETEKVIREYIGTGDDLLLTALAAQRRMEKFIDEGSAQRDAIISRFLDLQVFEKLLAYAKEDSSVIKKEVERAPDQHWDDTITVLKEELEEHTALIASHVKQLEEATKRLDMTKLQLAAINVVETVSPSDVATQEKVVSGLADDLAVAQRVHETLLKKIEILKDAVFVKDEAMAKVPLESLREKLRLKTELGNALKDARHAHEKASTILGNQQASAKKLLEVPCGDAFPGCKYIKDSVRDKSLISDQGRVVEDLLAVVEGIDSRLEELDGDDIQKRLDEYASLEDDKAKMAKELSQAELLSMRAKMGIPPIKSAYDEASVELCRLKELVVEPIDDGSDQLKMELISLEALIKKLDREKMAAASQQGSIQNQIQKLEAEKVRFFELGLQWRAYQLFMDATSKKGIPTQVVKAQLPIINAEIAKILHGIVDFRVELEKDAESNDLNIYIDDGASRRLLDTGSGMEKMVSAMAIRVSLMNVSSLPKPDFFIIDEGFSALDETYIEACNRFLVSLKKWFKSIIIISHLDGIKDIVDNIVEVARDAKGDSFVFSE